MSVKLMTKVWDSDLPTTEKFLCLALADFANDNGESVFPSQEYMAWKVSKDARSVRRALARLKELGVLVALSGTGGGRGITVHWRIEESALPAREPFRNPDKDVAKPGHIGTKPGQNGTNTRTPASYDPLVEPLDDPSVIPYYSTPRFSYNPDGSLAPLKANPRS